MLYEHDQAARHDASRDIETKLAAARTRLILDKPFLGALVLRLPMVAADPKWCPTTATDARSFYYNPAYIDSPEPGRRPSSCWRTRRCTARCPISRAASTASSSAGTWPATIAINPLLIKDGLKPPPGALVLAAYEGMTAEEIYPCIADDNTDEPMDQHASMTARTTIRPAAASRQGDEHREGGQGQARKPMTKASPSGGSQSGPAEG